ncbi:2-C-methyl-D-erythritol 4-phosphate cytidylyltransferase [Paenibacillus sp. N1-5-1-14]|uniref:2-C-methyl-D-erythritol 4-phosphate cytidylyltransferase n=1 Tax=Paenibacillus radicibacter TaxID=2972488 RepID=UPI0021597CA6|nr:2-C-methyl-D-erythritol 4-phosphate cytidylyltransferase [Paenibacillus radicibacter]MCR8645822.1 2-C-methyl-D-erythritol 4-phosphate cytidylyltransferase [Paenibacillus radicibacter]
MAKLGIVVVAAGRGSRMGTAESKQYLLLGGKPILVHTLMRLNQMKAIDSIVLVVGQEDVARCQTYIQQYGLTKLSHEHVIAGGSERQHSVRAGLDHLPSDVDWALVHDGVRPFVAEEHIEACWQEAMKHEAAVLAVPVKDTIKVVNEQGGIQSTPDRRSLWAIQTPQAFRLSLLKEAHRLAFEDHFVGTDDAMLVERLGVTVQVVESDYYNIKITTPEDLPWAEWILHNVRGEALL